MQVLEIAVLAFNDISPFHLSVPCLVFEDRAGAGLPRYRLRVCAGEPAGRHGLRTSAGFAVQTQLTLDDAAGADVLVVPSWRDAQERPPAAMVDAVRDAYARGATVVGLCLGAFVLAEAGVLDGREAATHWSAVQVFSQRYPRVKLVPDVLYVDADDGRLVTSAGTAAGLDCCLHLVRRWHGAEAANRVARRLVVAPHRQGGQAQYIEQPLHDAPGGNRLSDLLNWAAANLGEPHTLDTLAARAAMSRRNFTRRFRELTGTTVGRWLLAQRLAYAQRLLETTRQPVDVVAQQAGFGSAVSLREHFSRAYHTSPSAYRSVFAQA
jgi:transcriptional regulator GlxA family with amidase domain